MKQRYTARIAEIVASIVSKLPSKSLAHATLFTEQFYSQIPLAELELVSLDVVAPLANDTLEFMQHRPLGGRKIRIFKPEQATHGYDLPNTVLQVLNADKPFLVDSLTNALSAMGLTVHSMYHPIFHVQRNDQGELTNLFSVNSEQGERESLIHFELGPMPENITPEKLQEDLENVLDHVDLAIADWRVMLTRAQQAKDALRHAKHFNIDDVEETEAFIKWLMHKNFVFLGYAGVDFEGDGQQPKPAINKDKLFGISKIDAIPSEVSVAPQLVDLRKASRYSKVHRHALMDVVTVKRFDADGEIVGEHRFYGLLTSTAYYQNALDIPLIGRKIERLLTRAGFSAHSHNGKALVAILQFMPRDELFQISEEDLFDLSMGVLALETRPGVKLFARIDTPRRYISALAYVPRELFSTNVRLQVIQTLEKHFAAKLENYETSIGESALARLHIVFRASKKTPESLDIASIEQDIATTIMLWSDRLKAALDERYDSQKSEHLFRRYVHAFGTAYTSRYPILSTVYDIEKMEACLEHDNLEIELYRERKEDRKILHVKIYNAGGDIALSDILPKLENIGLKVVDEFPYAMETSDGKSLRMRDIRVELAHTEDVSIAQIKPNVEQLLLKVWNRVAEDDFFNALVLNCNLNVHQIEMLRAYYKYLRQIKFIFSRQVVAHALQKNSDLTLLLVQLFEARFDPNESDRDNKMSMLSSQIEQGLSHVESLQEDRIINTLHKLIMATLRTNYYIRATNGASSALSLKLDSAHVPNIPLPKPFVEIFVYSARVEGTHLRGGKVARGGLRWSDRHDDFRTEVLGLMKAQMVKNAVIVPVGSKGGFVVKQVDPLQRDEFRAEGVQCYKEYLRGLLDITDNIVDGQIITPKHIVRHDDDDPYLVVAADKGTATFSDIANGVSKEYNFWLDDAFASGGSAGYDHKQMGITARGGWVSVERHFREMGHDMATTPFTVAGIGDMSGDVFGNGMLLSQQIKLIAAFNHLHIFLDPTPDPARSFAERQRLFDLPRSGWLDYDNSLISAGGGVFDRKAKEVVLTPQIQKALDTTVKSCSPDELIRLILKAPTDLLWNGGIGTYVKASFESNEDVGDRANNSVRINGEDVRAKVIGEGGNLGLTQQGRIEYAKSGGRINTDAIDNSGGVDCSDHEVNIKIAFKQPVASGQMTLEQRNALLESMTSEVARLVLRDNQLQTQAISVEQQFAAERLPSHAQIIRALEARGMLNRTIEYLPDERQLSELKENGGGLTRPEISVLLAYSKLALFADIIDSSMPDEPYFAVDLKRYFPVEMQEKFADAIHHHSLRREIIATVATNSMVNRAGIGFYFDVLEDTRLPARAIVAAYSLARDILRMRDVWGELEKHDNIPPAVRARMFDSISDLLKHATYWLLRHRRLPLDIDQIMEEFCAPACAVMQHIMEMLSDKQQKGPLKRKAELMEQGVGEAFAQQMACLPYLKSLMEICRIAEENKKDVVEVGKVYFAMAENLRFGDIIKRSKIIVTDNRWDRLALQSLVHDFYDQVARLVAETYSAHQGDIDAFSQGAVNSLGRYNDVVKEMFKRDHLSSPMLMVALQQLKQVNS